MLRTIELVTSLEETRLDVLFHRTFRCTRLVPTRRSIDDSGLFAIRGTPFVFHFIARLNSVFSSS